MAVYLAHESCEVTGEIYSCGGGRVARSFVGVTPGIVTEDLSVETMGERLAEIRAEDGYAVPASMNEEMGIAIKAMS